MQNKKNKFFNNVIKTNKEKVDRAERLLEKNKGSLYASNRFYSSEFEITLPLG